MAYTLHLAAALCLWPPHECLTIGTSEGNRSFLVQDVPGDGNCFFHRLIVAIGWGFADSIMLRNVICGYVLQNWELWQSHVTLYGEGRETKQPYSLQMVDNFCRINGCSSSSEISHKYMVESNKGILIANISPTWSNNERIWYSFTKWTFSVLATSCRIFHKFRFFLGMPNLWFNS